jgi:hypothetical protein
LGKIFAGVWLRADALWYLRIAVRGYGGDRSTYAFFPLYPVLVRALRILIRSEAAAGMIVASLACAGGFVFLFKVVEALLGERPAKAAVLALALFPTSFFFIAPYAESALLAAGSLALLMVLRRRPWAAAIAGAAAGLARPFGFLIALPMAAFGWNKGHRTASIASAAAAPLAMAAWMGTIALHEHDLRAGFTAQSIWQRQFSFPIKTILAEIKALHGYWSSDYGPYFLADLIALALGVALVAATIIALQKANKTPAAAGLGAYGIAAITGPLLVPYPGRPLLSFPRFVLALFPLFGAAALIPTKFRIPLLGISGALLTLSAALFVAGRPLF